MADMTSVIYSQPTHVTIMKKYTQGGKESSVCVQIKNGHTASHWRFLLKQFEKLSELSVLHLERDQEIETHPKMTKEVSNHGRHANEITE